MYKNGCRLAEDDKLIIAPRDKDKPPSWAIAIADMDVVWVNTDLFKKLNKLRYKKPCDICPEQIKAKCKYVLKSC